MSYFISSEVKLFKRINGKIYIDNINRSVSYINDLCIEDATIINMCGGLEKIYSFDVLLVNDMNEINLSKITSKTTRGLIGKNPFIAFRYTMEDPDTMYYDGLYLEILYFDGEWKFKGDDMQISMGYSIEDGSSEITERLFNLMLDKAVCMIGSDYLKIKLV